MSTTNTAPQGGEFATAQVQAQPQRGGTGPAGAVSYSPPLETICGTCGGKYVGSCSMNYCRSSAL